jgi:hypothetical protein
MEDSHWRFVFEHVDRICNVGRRVSEGCEDKATLTEAPVLCASYCVRATEYIRIHTYAHVRQMNWRSTLSSMSCRQPLRVSIVSIVYLAKQPLALSQSCSWHPYPTGHKLLLLLACKPINAFVIIPNDHAPVNCIHTLRGLYFVSLSEWHEINRLNHELISCFKVLPTVYGWMYAILHKFLIFMVNYFTWICYASWNLGLWVACQLQHIFHLKICN